MGKDDVRIPQWISWLSGAIIGAITIGLTLAAYAFTTFETKESIDKRDAWLEKRLDRIELKIDQLQDKR